MNRDELLEKIAEVMHDAWSDWSEAVASEVSEERRARWEGFWVPYDQLDEGTKDLDREWAMVVMEAIEPELKDEEMGPPEEDEIEMVDELPEVEIEPAVTEPMEEEVDESVKSAEKKVLEMITKVNVDASKYPSIAKVLAEKYGISMLAKVRSNSAE